MAARPLITAAVLAAGIAVAAGAGAQTPVGPQPAPVSGAPARASVPAAAPAGVDDPYEGFNRRSYAFSTALDRRFLRPGVVFYHHATPTPIRRGVHNVLINMTNPVIIINDALQLRPVRALTALGRFTVNSTVGIGGVFDVAGSDLPYRNSDFGLTLARYGVRTGPYIYIPILGPTTVRDGAGRVADAVIDPFNSINYAARDILSPVRAVAGGVDARDQVDPLLKDLDRTATDPYATIRSAYLQNREAQVRGEAASAASVQALPDFGPAPTGPAPTGPAAPGPAAAEPDGPMAPPPPTPAPGASASAAPSPSEDRVADLLWSLDPPSASAASGA